MSEHRPALEHIQAYADHLRLEEKSAATVEKYLRDVRAFARWLEGREITKERTAAWKTHLVERGYAPASVNAMLSALKGKIRTILIPSKLCRKLLKYAKQQKTASGEIFLTRNGTPLSRRQIWAEMKGLCKTAGVAASKVFPHNLRHLFAAAFYRASRDIVKLADVLGHSSLETTRIYLLTSGAEHQRQLDRLGLVS